MKKITYAVLGSLLVTTAVLLRTLGDGGSELVALMLIGLVLLVGSVDLPANSQRGKV